MREEFDAYRDDLNLEDYALDEEYNEDDQSYDNSYNIPTVEQLDGSYGYDDDQWD